MIRFQCDTCADLKKSDEVWIMGYAAESVGVTAARREINIALAWDDRNAVDWLAVHFCSDECREGYMQRLFRKAPEPLPARKSQAVVRTSTKKTTAARKHVRKRA
ncbi:MAG: hypothetical protein JWO13_1461 [Acidobacteriales bacterium]|nr:hypothetical protein [Terriglobales bacterium]